MNNYWRLLSEHQGSHLIVVSLNCYSNGSMPPTFCIKRYNNSDNGKSINARQQHRVCHHRSL